ncbi:carboxylesterase family protein [Lentzea guizhouensis]|uniref:carboxylesterase family protein n=1 Tax=Lentzea guizhouensis TaxID=1586287 RepID=UPI001F3C523B|nr:carboxylesterase family protein [Lentzea guizhouensis]
MRGRGVPAALPASALLPAHAAFGTPAYGTAVLPVDPVVAQRTGRMHHVPTLVGSTHDEATLFAALIFPQPIPTQAYRQTLQGLYEPQDVDAVLARYPADGNGDVRDELARIMTDQSWACTVHDTRRELGRHQRVSGYEFADATVPVLFPDLPPFPGGYKAYHASELLMLFDFPGVTLTPAQRKVSDYMVAAWGRFARTGDPGWRADVQSLAPDAIGPTDFARDHQCGFWATV